MPSRFIAWTNASAGTGAKLKHRLTRVRVGSHPSSVVLDTLVCGHALRSIQYTYYNCMQYSLSSAFTHAHMEDIQKKEVNYYICRCSNRLKIEMQVLFRHTRTRKYMPSWKCMCPKSIKIVLFYICYYEYLNNLANMSTKHLYETCNITAPN